MIDNFRVPILLIGFNRPRTLSRQLQRISKLAPRHIYITIDGPDDRTFQVQSEVITTAVHWADLSEHKVDIVIRKTNLGIYNHFPLALGEFFEKFDFGLILEDDIEFSPIFVDFLDSKRMPNNLDKFWSVCGHNPLNINDPHRGNIDTFSFRPSHFHSVWGWAAGRDHAQRFVSDYSRPLSNNEISATLQNISRSFSRDPFLRRAFCLTWTKKMLGWNNRRSQSGWDTRWVFEAWRHESFSLLSENSLSREEMDQTEGQTHQHPTSRSIWNSQATNKCHFRIEEEKRYSDSALLQTWGISRKYSWVYANRIVRQERDLYL